MIDKNFQKGFEKTAIFGAIVKGMPKIFKWATHSKGKFNPKKSFSVGLGTLFAGSEAGNVISKTKDQVNKRVLTSQL